MHIAVAYIRSAWKLEENSETALLIPLVIVFFSCYKQMAHLCDSDDMSLYPEGTENDKNEKPIFQQKKNPYMIKVTHSHEV